MTGSWRVRGQSRCLWAARVRSGCWSQSCSVGPLPLPISASAGQRRAAELARPGYRAGQRKHLTALASRVGDDALPAARMGAPPMETGVRSEQLVAGGGGDQTKHLVHDTCISHVD